MNRFFSKLDLRDIKINPEGSRFPPDADETDASPEEPAEHPESAQDVVAETAQPDTAPPTPSEWSSEQRHAPETPNSFGVTAEVPEHAPSNGHVAEADVYAAEDIAAIAGEVLKVSARSRPSAVAGAIAGVVREAGKAEVQAIGAGATNQAVKAVAIARDYLRETGIEAVCLPAFIDVTIENEDRTAIRLVVEPR